MNSVPFALNPSVRRSAAALLATLLLAPACGDDGGTTDTDDMTTGNTMSGMTTAMSEPTTGDDMTGGSTGMTAQLSHAADIQPIWDMYCTMACHEAGGNASTYFLLTSDVAYDSIVSKMSTSYPALTLVTPGDKVASYLWHKINATQVEAGGGGSKMPLVGSLPAEDIEAIGAWIDQGAKP